MRTLPQGFIRIIASYKNHGVTRSVVRLLNTIVASCKSPCQDILFSIFLLALGKSQSPKPSSCSVACTEVKTWTVQVLIWNWRKFISNCSFLWTGQDSRMLLNSSDCLVEPVNPLFFIMLAENIVLTVVLITFGEELRTS